MSAEERERKLRREIVRLKDALGRALGNDWEWRDDGERIWFCWIGEPSREMEFEGSVTHDEGRE